MSAPVSLADLEALWTSAGGPANETAAAAAIADAESSGNAGDNIIDSNGLPSIGLWQINGTNFAWLQSLGVNTANLTDPATNAKAAVLLATKTPKGLTNWSTWNSYVNGDGSPAATTITKDLASLGGQTYDPSTGGTATAFNLMDPSTWLIGTVGGGPQSLKPLGSNGPVASAAKALVPSWAGVVSYWAGLLSNPIALGVVATGIGLIVIAAVLARSSAPDEEISVSTAPAAQGA